MSLTIVSRTAAGLPAPPSSLSRRSLSSWAGITCHHTGGAFSSWLAIHQWQTAGRPAGERLAYIGYSFGIAPDGAVTELRGWDYHPAHDHDNSRLGVVFGGTFQSSLPTRAALDSFVALCRLANAKTGKRLQVVGHRDVRSTGCPGDRLYRELPVLRARIEEDDMPTADEVADAMLRRRIRWSNDWPVQRWGANPDGYLVQTYLSQGYALSRSAHEGVAELAAGQAAILARLDGADDGATRQAIRAELEAHRGELLAEVRAEIGDLLDQVGERDADAIVTEIARRLAPSDGEG